MAGGIPQNAKAIWGFLLAMGATPNAAAGVLGNIEQESGGNPNAGTNPPGRGLIQKLGDPGGTLAHELGVMRDYINANGGIKLLNEHAHTPAEAALFFSSHYERPGIPDNANRVASAEAVARAAKSGNWPKSSDLVTTSASGGSAPALGSGNTQTVSFDPLAPFDWLGSMVAHATGTATTIGDLGTAVGGIVNDLSTVIRFMSYLFEPQLWLRVGAFFAGILALVAGVFMLSKALGSGQGSGSVPIPIPV